MTTTLRRAGDTAFLGHPRALGTIVLTEAWERFAQYGMQTLLVLYLVGTLLRPGHVENIAGFPAFRALLEGAFGPLSPTALASAIFGIYGSVIYLTPILGGFLADRVLGRTRTVIAGSVLMMSGHFLMMGEQSFLLALLLLILGIGCFKGNLAAQINALYAEGDTRRRDAYQIYTLAVNAGVIAAPLVAGTLGEVYGWRYGFGAAGLGMAIGLGVYLAGRRHLPADPPLARGHGTRRALLTAREKAAALALLGLLPVLAVAAVGNQQIFNAYLMWADGAADLTLLGRRIPTTWLITIDMIASIICLVGVMGFWRVMAARGFAPGEMTRIVIGCGFSAAAYAVLAGTAWIAEGAKVGLVPLLVFHMLGSIAFAHVYPVSLALYARVSPPAIASTMMGIYYLHLFGANALTGWIGGLLGETSAHAFWLLHGAIGIGAGAALIVVRMLAGRILAGP